MWLVRKPFPCSSGCSQVVPASLLEMSRSVMRRSFSAIVPKVVYTFSFNRHSHASRRLLTTLRTAQDTGAIVCASPQSVKAFMLKLVEMLHTLDSQHKREAMTSMYSSVKDTFSQLFSSKQRSRVREYAQEELAGMRDEIGHAISMFKVRSDNFVKRQLVRTSS